MSVSQKEFRKCKAKFENYHGYKTDYYCKLEKECCSTQEEWNGCCTKPTNKFLESAEIEVQYIIAIAAVAFVILCLIIIGLCVVLRKRRRRRSKYTPSAPPLSEMSPVPPYSANNILKLPSYDEACPPQNVYNFT